MNYVNMAANVTVCDVLKRSGTSRR